MEKKVGILTFHSGLNYGASLQAYALKCVLNSKNLDTSVIDFRKEKSYGDNFWKNFFSCARLARCIYEIPYSKQIGQKKKQFERFVCEELTEKKTCLVTEDAIENVTQSYQALIFGSDQIWNLDPRIYDRSKVFFADFDYSGKKYAYSASFGEDISFANEHKKYIIKQLTGFRSISVREKSGQEFLVENGIDAVHTVDPTLLLKKEEWEKLINDTAIVKGKYILYYSVNCRRYSWEIAKKLSELTHMPVINLVEHPKVFMAGFKNCYDKGPLEFLNIIKNAEYVVTNSFHGVAFSINFKKKFAPVFQTIDGKIQLEERKYDLLKRVGLESLIVTDMNEEVLKKISTIDYSAVEKKLDAIRKESLSYIDGVVNDLNN